MNKYNTFNFFVLPILILLLGCCSDSVPKKRMKAEAIFRTENEKLLLAPPEFLPRKKFPWEQEGKHPKITKDFFRCKGCSEHPPYPRENSQEALFDCKGSHGLPQKEGKEFIYPILIELLNHVQNETGKKVIITTGHRCVAHNRYADPSSDNTSSKHLLGAEVDFYVEGLEHDPMKIINLLQQSYAKEENPSYRNFLRFDKPTCKVRTQPWYNKEIFIKLYLPDEGRDKDNIHPYPYICIQLRIDRSTGERISYDPQKAQNFLRN